MDIDVTFKFSVADSELDDRFEYLSRGDPSPVSVAEQKRFVDIAVDFFSDLTHLSSIPVKVKSIHPRYERDDVVVDVTLHTANSKFLEDLDQLVHTIYAKSIWRNNVNGFYIRDVTYKVTTVSNVNKKCTKGTRLNKATNRCRKVCAKGTHRNRMTQRCQKNKDS